MKKSLNSLEIIRLPVGQMAANCYVIFDPQTRDAIIIDPGDDGQYIIETIIENSLTPTAIVATHGHFDHMMAASELQISFNIPFLVHKKDEFLVKRMQQSAEYFLKMRIVDPPAVISGPLVADQKISIGIHRLMVIETPGHTPGSVSLYCKDGEFIIVGDVVFAGGLVGSTDHDYSSPLQLAESIRIITGFLGNTILYPGHGEETNISDFVQASKKQLQ